MKQIDANREDLKDLADLRRDGRTADARWIRNRLSQTLKDVSAQLKAARIAGEPTIVVAYDNTPFKSALDHDDVVQGMFGELTYVVAMHDDADTVVGPPYFGKNRRMGPHTNTSVSALAVLRDSSDGPVTLELYCNPFAAVPLSSVLVEQLPAMIRLELGSTHVQGW